MSIKEKNDQFYAYNFIKTVEREKGFSIYPNIVKANSKREFYIKIFYDNFEEILFYFVHDNSNDSIIQEIFINKKIIDHISLALYLSDRYYVDIGRNTWNNDIMDNKEYIENLIYKYIKHVINDGDGLFLNVFEIFMTKYSR